MDAKKAVRMLGRHGGEPRGMAILTLGAEAHQLLGYGGGGRAQGRFGRMFGALPEDTTSEADLVALGTLMTRDRLAESTIPAGFTYFGQFVDHDVTLDKTPLPDAERDPLALLNFRTPALDLDSLYGLGPTGSPQLYEADGVHLRVGELEAGRGPNTGDLPRDSAGKAVLGDDRNDENLVVAQLHLVFIRFHNRVVDWFAARGTAPERLFASARKAVTWHYQWVVVHDFLARIVDADILEDIKRNGPRFYHPVGPKPFMPVEFSVAAYRFGHSMVRDHYHFQRDPDATFAEASLGQLFTFTELFAASAPNRSVAGTAWPLRPQDWAAFVELDPKRPPQGSAPIDIRLADTLGALPQSAMAAMPNLAVRNLLRGRFYGLPSGQSVATAMGETVLTPAQVSGGLRLPPGTDEQTPLWYYVLREGHVQRGGNGLGRVGGRIVAEVFLGILQNDSTSYLNYRLPRLVPPALKPILPELDIASILPRPPRPDELLGLIEKVPARPMSAAARFVPALPETRIDLRNPALVDALAIFRRWRPFLGPTPGAFTLAELVRFANEGP